jgi:hypothetical protein
MVQWTLTFAYVGFFNLRLTCSNVKGDDEYAMKSAGLELAGLTALFESQIHEIHLPMMALIDYRYLSLSLYVPPKAGA